MADEVVWPIELIPDADSVFMRAHKDYFRSGDLLPGVFREQDGSMSVDWNKYSSAHETRERGKNPMANAVLRLSVGNVRSVNSLDVEHTPEPDNRAHSEINLPSNREDLTEVRLKLLRIAVTALPLQPTSTHR